MVRTGREQGYVRLDPGRIEARRRYLRLGMEELIRRTDLDPRTARGMIGGRRGFESSAWAIVRALELERLDDVLPGPADGRADGPPRRTFEEWDVAAVVSPWRTTSNELQYQVCRMEHRLLPGTLGRGKCYELRYLSDDRRAAVEHLLVRHPIVCRRLGPHPRFPVNERVGYEGREFFWVIDRWEAGRTLAEILRDGPLDAALLPGVMRQIAEGLDALHARGIIRRELTPEFVVVRDADASVLLTDLELAKLLDGSPTVGREWAESPYLAPELGSDAVDRTVDLFSWGQILFHAATGRRPARYPAPDAFDEMPLPRVVRQVAARCVDARHRFRPRDVAEVLKAVRQWR